MGLTVGVVVVAAAAPAGGWEAGRSVDFLFTGDVLVHQAISRAAARNGAGEYDFQPMFARVAPLVSAVDWAICHLEVSLGVPDTPTSPFPLIAAPAAVAETLADAGFDACSIASNHALDFGPVGVASTIEALDSAGIGHTGTALEEADSHGQVYDLGEVKVGHLSFAYGFNGFRLPVDAPWLANRIDLDRILADAARLRESGADLVVVSLHWGAEYRSTPLASQVELASQLTGSPDIDLIVGHHAHVIQPFASVAGKPVAYGLGNFLSNQSAGCCAVASQDGMMLLVRAHRHPGGWMFDEFRYVPTWVDRRDGYVITPASDSSELAVLRQATVRTREVLHSLTEEVQEMSLRQAYRWVTAEETALRLGLLCGGTCPPTDPVGLKPG
jgi:poly-gamma-glutamate synthesis protein (capsule biosynthesis protein)